VTVFKRLRGALKECPQSVAARMLSSAPLTEMSLWELGMLLWKISMPLHRPKDVGAAKETILSVLGELSRRDGGESRDWKELIDTEARVERLAGHILRCRRCEEGHA